ncbi:MAG: hypothetical protein KA144_06605 [Xanthomonadaceae bacterium]|nr:hypothetical protein [Xanthomonadaceae bacterium]
MNTSALKLLAFAMLVSPLCAAATLAQTTVAQTAVAVETAQTTPAADDVAQTSSEPSAQTSAAQPQPARTCLTLTGSRVTAQRNLRAAREGRPERECVNSAGRVYSEDDIERTGQRSVADALRSLDTGIR